MQKHPKLGSMYDKAKEKEKGKNGETAGRVGMKVLAISSVLLPE